MAALRSLKFRIALTIFALECVMMVVTLWQTSAAQTEALRRQQLATQDAVLELVARVSRTALLTDEFGELKFYFEHLQQDPHVKRVLLGNAQGRVVASADIKDLGQPLPALEPGRQTDWRSTPIVGAATLLGTLAVQFSTGELLRAQAEARRLGLVIAAIGMTLIALVGLGLGVLLTRRLERLAQAANRMATGDREVRAGLSGNDELAAVGHAFDDMADAVARQERELREQREHTELLLGSTAEAIFGVDKTGTCTFANPSCLRMLGYDREADLIGKNMHALIHHTYPDGRPYPAEQCRVRNSTLQGIPAHSDEEVHWRADGSSFPVEFWSHPMHRGGELIGAVVTFVDISERKQAEQALREERNFTSAVLSHAGAVVLVLDREGRIRRFNRAAEQLSGRSFAEVEGRFPWDTVLPPEVAPVVREQAFDALANDPQRLSGAFTNEWQNTRGERRMIDWSNTLLLDADGRMQFMVSVGVDVTERRSAEERTRIALREKELLLKEIYHRVKNNLQVVISLLTLQARNTPDAVARGPLHDSANRIKSMALVHEQLYQAGGLAAIGLADYFAQLLHHIADAQRDPAARVHVDSEVVPVEVGIETAVPLGLIVNELVTNAYKHAFPAHRPGKITLRLAATDDGRLELSVSDDGVGLPAGLDPGRATSLGLRLVLSLSEQLGATVDQSSDGGGCRFALRFQPELPELTRLPGGLGASPPDRRSSTDLP
jgi:PAS domain S-box-containing protein